MKVGVVGASGFTGTELLRLCAGRRDLDVVVVTAEQHAGRTVAETYPSLAAAYGGVRYEVTTPEVVDGLDLVFLCLPHGASQRLVPEIVDRVGTVVDLAADFRLRLPEQYDRWYGAPHLAPELLDSFAYGLPELFRSEIVGATRIASPGCYPTAAALALRPLIDAGVVRTSGVVVDAASGVSGAGTALARTTQFTTVDENFMAYGLLDHRHTPEIEQATGAEVLFTPHLAPMNRGILATCYAPLAEGAAALSTDDAVDLLRQRYDGEPFVVVADVPPSTKATAGSNAAHLTVRVDARTGWVVSLCAIDNLLKGAAGQAMQAANIALGVPETSGLSAVGVYP
ncbi:MAG: N-acetyl-gamma-glutamyl-phosphate reductase [Actinomycetota bacterium]|nr:N-acetyl-gamma-glutamyl-phosphate reductase [Actinomycetota bacterium]